MCRPPGGAWARFFLGALATAGLAALGLGALLPAALFTESGDVPAGVELHGVDFTEQRLGPGDQVKSPQMAGRPAELPHKLLSLHELSTRGNIQAVLSGFH